MQHDIELHYLELWQGIVRAHSRSTLQGFRLLIRPHDYISMLIKTRSWRETLNVLKDIDDHGLRVIVGYADVNLKIATNQLKGLGIYYFSIVIPFMVAIITEDILRLLFTGVSVLMIVLLILPALLCIQGRQAAFLIKMSIECYMKARLGQGETSSTKRNEKEVLSQPPREP